MGECSTGQGVGGGAGRDGGRTGGRGVVVGLPPVLFRSPSAYIPASSQLRFPTVNKQPGISGLNVRGILSAACRWRRL